MTNQTYEYETAFANLWKIADHVAALIVCFRHDVEQERLDIVIKRLVIQEQLGEETEILAVNLQHVWRACWHETAEDFNLVNAAFGISGWSGSSNKCYNFPHRPSWIHHWSGEATRCIIFIIIIIIIIISLTSIFFQDKSRVWTAASQQH